MLARCGVADTAFCVSDSTCCIIPETIDSGLAQEVIGSLNKHVAIRAEMISISNFFGSFDCCCLDEASDASAGR